jgi:hypothetical protein
VDGKCLVWQGCAWQQSMYLCSLLYSREGVCSLSRVHNVVGQTWRHAYRGIEDMDREKYIW